MVRGFFCRRRLFSLSTMLDPCIPPLPKEGEEIAQPPTPVEISKYYLYPEGEVESILEGIKTKRFSSDPADLTVERLANIRYLIICIGLRIHSDICMLNSELEWLRTRSLRYPTAAERQFLRQMFPAFELSEMGRERTLLFISSIKFELLPDLLRLIIDEIVKMLEEGFRKLCEAKVYKAMLEDFYRQDDHRKQIAREEEDSRRQKLKNSRILAKQMAMELSHVQVTRGFIYLLSSEKVPGLFKVGFTQRNPDERAKEVSHRRYPQAVFQVQKYWRTDDPYIVEQRIFTKLFEFRDKVSEYYCCDLELLVEIIEESIASIGSEDLVNPAMAADPDLDLPLSWVS